MSEDQKGIEESLIIIKHSDELPIEFRIFEKEVELIEGEKEPILEGAPETQAENNEEGVRDGKSAESEKAEIGDDNERILRDIIDKLYFKQPPKTSWKLLDESISKLMAKTRAKKVTTEMRARAEAELLTKGVLGSRRNNSADPMVEEDSEQEK